jgi:iron complex outermembrane recepter protein
MKLFLKGHCSLLALGMALSAQATALSARAAEQAAPGAAAAVAPTESNVGEVTVTARKREERLLDVPIAVTALSGDELSKRGLTSVDQLVQVVPSMQVTSNQGKEQVSVTLRGIGLSNQFNANTASPVAVYSDEVYQSFRPSPGLQQFDLQRVEVLRGPQGTLFGRNTTGGAIDFVSVLPKLDGAANGYVTLGYGNYNRFTAEGATDVTLVDDKLGFRLSAQYVKADGYIHDLGESDGGAENAIHARIMIRAKPTPNLDLVLKIYGGRGDGTVPGGIANGVGPGQTNLAGYSRANLPNDTVDTNFPAPLDTKASGIGLNAKWTSGPFTVTSISQYDQGAQLVQFDCDGSPATLCQSKYDIHGYQINQDLRLSYDTSQVNAVVGAYYGWDRISYNSFVGFGGATFLRDEYIQTRSSEAVYGESTYNFTSEWSFTGGIRYTLDQNQLSDVQAALLDSFEGTPLTTTIPVPTGAPYSPTNFLPTINRDTSGLTGRAIARYKFDSNKIAYASISWGYRSGAFNGSEFFSPAEANFVAPETVTTYELGFKGNFYNRLDVEAATFFNDLHNQQVLSSARIAGAVEPNLASLSGYSYGAELEAQFRVTSSLRLTGNVSVLRTRYDDNQNVIGIPVGGNQFPFAPDYTALAQFDWTAWRGDNNALVLTGSVSYMGHYFYDPEDGAGEVGKTLVNGSQPYALVDGRLSYNTPRYSIAIYGRNLANQYYLPFNSNAESLGFDYGTRGMPRTFGVEVRAAF